MNSRLLLGLCKAGTQEAGYKENAAQSPSKIRDESIEKHKNAKKESAEHPEVRPQPKPGDYVICTPLAQLLLRIERAM